MLTAEVRNGFARMEQGFEKLEQSFEKADRRAEEQAEKRFWQFWKVLGGVAGISV